MTSRIKNLAQQLNMASNFNIHLYTAQTPNGIKASILLEELGLSYQTTNIDITKNVQKEEWFLEINPNGRIPALTDKWSDGSTIRLFESGSILQYLVDRMGGLGPMQGQSNHFTRYAPEKIPYGISRYQNETRRLYRVMDTALAKSKSGFLVGDRVTIADISAWGWVSSAKWAGVDIGEFPSLKAWLHKLLERPGFEKGRHVPSQHTAFKMAEMSEEVLEEKAARSREWIQAGMKDDAKK